MPDALHKLTKATEKRLASGSKITIESKRAQPETQARSRSAVPSGVPLVLTGQLYTRLFAAMRDDGKEGERWFLLVPFRSLNFLSFPLNSL